MTILLSDSFDRSTLQESWVKSGSNPLTADGYGDPCVFYESGTWHVFADDLSANTIVRWSTSNPESLGSPTTVISTGTAGTWDSLQVRDPHVVKVGSTYYLFYSGQTDSSPSSTTHKIGYATATAINGTYTKYGSNPIITGASVGVNEPTVDYDAARTPAWNLLCTSGSGGDSIDIGLANIARYTASTPSGTWTLQGNILSTTYQDQEQVKVSPETVSDTFIMNVNGSGQTVNQCHSYDDAATFSSPTTGGTLTIGSGGSFDDVACYAPTYAWDSANSQWRCYYQGATVTTHRLATATRSTLNRWLPEDATYWECTGSVLRKKTSNTAGWKALVTEYKFNPADQATSEYWFQTDLYFESENDTAYMSGVILCEDATAQYAVIFDPSTNTMALWHRDQSILSSTTSYPFTTATQYKIRAKITASTINVDWYDGSSWNTDVLTATGKTIIDSAVGFLGYANSSANNYVQFDNFYLTDAQYSETATATASGSGSGTGSASATVVINAVSAGNGSGTGTATATVDIQTSASGSGSGTGAAAATVVIVAVAAGSGSGDGAAVVTPTVTGSASGSGSGDGAATAVVTINAIASGSGSGDGAASATVQITGVAAGSGGGTGLATATITISATASGSGSGTGVVIVAGVPVVYDVTIAVAAVGAVAITLGAEMYHVGDTLKITGTFTLDGTETDPTSVSLQVRDPSGNTATYTYADAEVSKVSTGVFSYNLLLDEDGNWFVKWVGEGAVVTATEDTKLKVERTRFVYPPA